MNSAGAAQEWYQTSDPVSESTVSSGKRKGEEGKSVYLSWCVLFQLRYQANTLCQLLQEIQLLLKLQTINYAGMKVISIFTFFHYLLPLLTTTKD